MAERGAESNLVNVHPQQNVFTFDSIKFSSCFDSGNLAKVAQSEPFKVLSWPALVRPLDFARRLALSHRQRLPRLVPLRSFRSPLRRLGYFPAAEHEQPGSSRASVEPSLQFWTETGVQIGREGVEENRWACELRSTMFESVEQRRVQRAVCSRV